MPTKLQKNQIATTLIDGWTPADATWTYASASTITVPSGAASIYQKGDRIKWTQTTVKYGVIVAVADTLLTIAVNTDYTVANAAISANYFSHQANPLGYPHWFNFSPTWGGFSVSPSNGFIRYNIVGSMCTYIIMPATGGTSNATSLTITAPVAAAKSHYSAAWISGTDNAVNLTTPCHIETIATSATLSAYKTFYQGAWTGSGSKSIYGSISYEF